MAAEPAAGRVRGALLRIGAAAALLFAISWFVDLRKTVDVLFTIAPVTYGACAVLLFVQTCIAGVRWHIVARACDTALPAGAAIRIFMIGQFFGQFLPSSIGGDAIRIVLARRHTQSVAAAISIVVNDRLIALVSAAGLITLAAPITVATIAPDGRLLALAVGGLLAFYAGLILVVMFGNRVLDYLQRFRLIAPALPIARDFLRLCRGRAAPVMFALSVVVHAFMVAAIGVAVRGAGIPLSIAEIAAVGPWIVVCAMLPISVGSWGVREASMVIGLGLVGVQVEHALAASLTVAAGQIVVAVIGMVLWLVAGAPRAQKVDGLSAIDR